MKRSHVLALTVSMLALAAPRPGAAAEPKVTALDVGPADAPMVMALTGIDRAEDQLFEFLDKVERLGLEDPGLRRLRAKGLAKLGKKKGTLASAVGLAPGGNVVLYGMPAEGRLRVVLVADVVDKDALLHALAVMQEADQWVPHGEKPKRATITRRQLGGGGFEATIALPESSGVVVRVHDGVAAVSDSPAALDTLRLAGGQRSAVGDRLVPGKVGFAVHVTPPPPGMTSSDFNMLGAVFERLDGVWLETGTGLEVDADLHFVSDVEPWLAMAHPSAKGEAARQVMRGMVGPDTGMWGRWSVDAQAAWSLAQTMLGDALVDIRKEVKRETGLDLERDIVNTVTGDLFFSCEDGLLSCVLVVGVQSSARGVSTVKRALAAMVRDDKRTRIGHERFSLPGGRTLFRTQVDELRWKDDENDPDEWKPQAQFWWGARDHALVVGLSRFGVSDALTRALSGPVGLPDFLQGHAFDANTSAAFHQQSREPMRIMRLVAAVVRAFTPAESPLGIGARAFELYAAAEDYMGEQASILTTEGLAWHVHGEMRALPMAAGDPGFDATLAGLWDAALALRYQGRTRASNEAMMDLATRAPDSPWGQKARRYALASDDLSVLTSMLYFFGAVGARGFAHGFDDEVRMPEAAPQSYDSCATLESMTCSGPGYNEGSCNIAQSGDIDTCAQELEALLNP